MTAKVAVPDVSLAQQVTVFTPMPNREQELGVHVTAGGPVTASAADAPLYVGDGGPALARRLLPCRCKLFAICWGLGISCTLRDFTNLP